MNYSSFMARTFTKATLQLCQKEGVLKSNFIFFPQEEITFVRACNNNVDVHIQEHWLTWRYIFATKNVTCVIQTHVWMVERAPGQNLEGIGVSARLDIAERTVQVMTTAIPYVTLNGTTITLGDLRIECTFALFTIYLENELLFVFIST